MLIAAATLMRRNGYKGTSLADLAEALNITKPTVYYYFESKEQLLVEIVTSSQDQILEALRGIVAEDIPAIEKLRQMMFKYVECISTDSGAIIVMASYIEIGDATRRMILAKSREANELIYSVLSEGEKDGTLRISDSTLVLHTIFGALNWIPRWYRPDGRLPLADIAAGQIDILIDGVRGPAAAPVSPQPKSPRVRLKRG